MWHYINNGQQQGPVDDHALDQLLANGTINADTLVWKEGLADWAALQQVRPTKALATASADTPSATCTMCGKMVGSDNLIELGGNRICAACKPLAVQALREGAMPVLKGAPVAWRDDTKVVTQNGSTLPPRCYKCNKPGQEPPLKRNLQWHPPGYYLIIIIGLLIYIIVALIVRKKATVDIYLCPDHALRRKRFMIGGWSGTLLGLGLIIAGISMNSGATIGIGFLIGLASPLVGIIGASSASARRIKDDTVWLSGAGKEFLESLPRWP